MSASEAYSRILGFLLSEGKREGLRQVVAVKLVYCPGTDFRNEEIKSWTFEKAPAFFAIVSNVEGLAAAIVEHAEEKVQYVDPAVRHRFSVCAVQYLGAQQRLSFVWQPMQAEETKPSNMMQESAPAQDVHKEMKKLRKENAKLRRELETSLSNRSAREFQTMLAASKKRITEKNSLKAAKPSQRKTPR